MHRQWRVQNWAIFVSKGGQDELQLLGKLQNLLPSDFMIQKWGTLVEDAFDTEMGSDAEQS